MSIKQGSWEYRLHSFGYDLTKESNPCQLTANCSATAPLFTQTIYMLLQPVLGVNSPDEALLFCIMSPAGPYFASDGDSSAISLLANPKITRACKGGAGAFKLGRCAIQYIF